MYNTSVVDKSCLSKIQSSRIALGEIGQVLNHQFLKQNVQLHTNKKLGKFVNAPAEEGWVLACVPVHWLNRSTSDPGCAFARASEDCLVGGGGAVE
jgi:hypothetical protein